MVYYGDDKDDKDAVGPTTDEPPPNLAYYWDKGDDEECAVGPTTDEPTSHQPTHPDHHGAALRDGINPILDRHGKCAADGHVIGAIWWWS